MVCARNLPERREEVLSRSMLSVAALIAAAALSGCSDDNAACERSATCATTPPGDAGRDAYANDQTVDLTARDAAGDSTAERDGSPPDASPPFDASRDGALTDGDLADAPRKDGDLADVVERDTSDMDRTDIAEPTDAALIDVPDGALIDAPDGESCDLDAGRSPLDRPCLITERYGVFVSPLGSDATGAGTRTAPFRTMARAIHAAKADTRRVYACDDGTGYEEGIVLDSSLDGFELFGGFDCAAWKVGVAGRTRIETATGPALTTRGLVLGVTIDRFDLAGADAAIGASSLAVILSSSANVVLRNARIVAGRGGAGLAGATGWPGADGDVAGPEQDGAPSECDPPQYIDHLGGAWARASVCGSRGGSGLASNALSDAQAESGIPMTGVTPANQVNGGGGFLGAPAGPGSTGNPGDLGVPSAIPGTFSADGYVPSPAASAGTDGRTGQGGGGGVKGTTIWGCNLATGGAGGMGGCGGTGGLGGRGGGASVGIFSWSSSVLLDGCEIVASAGGAGGAGGNGGSGGRGMPGGLGGARWATDAGVLATAGEDGGKGGNGGDGGSGAGGNGGPSYAIVFQGARPTTTRTVLSAGAPGEKGVGGTVGGVKAPDGAKGVAANELML